MGGWDVPCFRRDFEEEEAGARAVVGIKESDAEVGLGAEGGFLVHWEGVEEVGVDAFDGWVGGCVSG